MRRRHVVFVAFLLVLATSGVATARAPARGVDAAAASCVAIAWPGSSQGAFLLAPDNIVGSGVVVDDELVLTAAHVVSDQQAEGIEILVRTPDGTYTGTIVGEPDSIRDLALLRVPELPNPPIEWGDNTALVHGEEVYSLGFPLGFEEVNVTRGIISSPSQKVDGSLYIVTDTSINPGNSGGALVDSKGRLLGVNVAAMEGYGDMGLTVPGHDARAYVSVQVPGSVDSGLTSIPEGLEKVLALGAFAAVVCLLTLGGIAAVIAVVRANSGTVSSWRPYAVTAMGAVGVAGVVLAGVVWMHGALGSSALPPVPPVEHPVSVSLEWDSDVDVDLLIFDETGNQPLLSSWFVCGPDVQDGSGAEYFDFKGYDERGGQVGGSIDLSAGDYVVGAYYCNRPGEGPEYDSVNVRLTLTMPDGSTVQRGKAVGWEPGRDVWLAFKVDAQTGAMEDVDEFVVVKGLYD